MEKSDRALYQTCEGVTERKIYLDYILDTYSKTPMKKCKPLIRSLLRMGAYQILFMDVRDAAACSEAVSLAKKRIWQTQWFCKWSFTNHRKRERPSACS
ncbi:MAG: transcription antitermination factor NusB [Anaerobutyricum soehngenii]